MAEKPILFNTEMVKAILDGRKTQTRRVIKPQPPCDLKMMTEGVHAGEWHLYNDSPMLHPQINSPWGAWYLSPYRPDDILWVRETWKQATTGTAGPGLIDLILYRADEPQDATAMMVEDRWHPSIHMPRKAARIFLRVKNVRAERLQDITEADAEAEGTDLEAWYDYDEWQHSVGDGLASDDCPVVFETKRGFFGRRVWDKTMQSVEQYMNFGWDANPWVWVIEFERVYGGPFGPWADRDTAQYADAGMMMPAI